MKNVLKVCVVLMVIASMTAYGSTIAHWNMADLGASDGAFMPGNGERRDLDADGAMDTDDFRISSLDLSGNGNHLSAWTSSWMKWSSNSDKGDFSMTSSNNYPAAGTDSEFNPVQQDPGYAGINAETVTLQQWTIEALFNSTNLTSNRTVVGRDGYGAGKQAMLYLQTRGTNMAVEYTDAAGVTHLVNIAAGLVMNQWYHVAAVSDGSLLSLYLDGSVIGSLDMTGSSTDTALAPDIDLNGDYYGWTVSRGKWGGTDYRNQGHVDRFFGFVDEVAISDAALAPASFVIPEPATLALLGLGALTMLRKRK